MHQWITCMLQPARPCIQPYKTMLVPAGMQTATTQPVFNYMIDHATGSNRTADGAEGDPYASKVGHYSYSLYQQQSLCSMPRIAFCCS